MTDEGDIVYVFDELGALREAEDRATDAALARLKTSGAGGALQQQQQLGGDGGGDARAQLAALDAEARER